MKKELIDFVATALGRGMNRDDIRVKLQQAGWPSQLVDKALRTYAEIDSPVPVPRPRDTLYARDAFIYLVQFMALYFALYHLVGTIFVIIDQLLPDPRYHNSVRLQHLIRWHISMIIVMAPLSVGAYIISSRRIARDPAARDSALRKWLTYLTLFLGVCVMAGNIVWIVYAALMGEIVLRLLLKAGAIFVLAGGTILFFYTDIRKGEQE